MLAAPTQEVDIQALQEQINALQAQINELKNAQNDKISKVELDKEIDTTAEAALKFSYSSSPSVPPSTV